jgi:hypothetical protein
MRSKTTMGYSESTIKTQTSASKMAPEMGRIENLQGNWISQHERWRKSFLE